MASNEEMLHFGMWVYKTQSLKRNEKSPPVFSHWKRYFMWFNKGTLFYGENEGEPDKSIPVATCRGAERMAIEDFAQRKPPTLLSDFGWILKTVEKTFIFVSDSDSQRTIWVDGINGMLPRGHQRSVSGYQTMFADPMAVSLNANNNGGFSSASYLTDPMGASHNNEFGNSMRSGGNNGHNQSTDIFGGNINVTSATPPPDYLTHVPNRGGPHQRTTSMGMYEMGTNFNPLGSDEGSPTRGYNTGHQRRASYAMGGFNSNALVPTGYFSGGSPATNSLVPYGDGSPNARSPSSQQLEHDSGELVAMGTFAWKMKGDKAEKGGSKKDWARKWMAMDGAVLWYGAERNQKDTSIDLSKCTSVERLIDEEMYKYRAPAEYYRYGLRLRAAGGRSWVFACETELAALGWYKVWKKAIPISTEELAMEAQFTYESNLAQENFLEEKHRTANLQREQEAKKKKEEQEKMAQLTKMMAENLVKAAKAAEENKRRQEEAKRKQQEEVIILKTKEKEKEKEIEDNKERELRQQEEFIRKEVAKRLKMERGEPLTPEEEILDPNDPNYAEKEIAQRVKKALKADQAERESERKKREERDKKETEEQRARNAEKERLANELRALEDEQIAVHTEATKPKKEQGGCCLVM